MIYWKRAQYQRDRWERKFHYLFRNVLNKQFRDLADKITPVNIGETIVHQMTDDPIREAMIKLYQTVGVAFARQEYRKYKSHDMLSKQEEPLDDWLKTMEAFAKNRAGDRIVSIAAGSRDQALKIIRKYLDQSLQEGWGAEETARAIRKGLTTDGIQINQWRSLRIARTEIVTASNTGTMMGARSSEFPLEKYWIAVQDSRTRETHSIIEEQNPKQMDEKFTVGAYMMEMPGDPDAGPEETINCRCVLATEVKGY